MRAFSVLKRVQAPKHSRTVRLEYALMLIAYHLRDTLKRKRAYHVGIRSGGRNSVALGSPRRENERDPEPSIMRRESMASEDPKKKHCVRRQRSAGRFVRGASRARGDEGAGRIAGAPQSGMPDQSLARLCR